MATKRKKDISKVPVSKIQVNLWDIISSAVERGIAFGYMRSHKHTDTPSEEHIKGQLYNEIMNELAEVIDFDE